MYDKECAILYDNKTKENLVSDLKDLNKKLNENLDLITNSEIDEGIIPELKHHIEYITDILGTPNYRCNAFKESMDKAASMPNFKKHALLSDVELNLIVALKILSTKKDEIHNLEIDGWECDAAELIFR